MEWGSMPALMAPRKDTGNSVNCSDGGEVFRQVSGFKVRRDIGEAVGETSRVEWAQLGRTAARP